MRIVGRGREEAPASAPLSINAPRVRRLVIDKAYERSLRNKLAAFAEQAKTRKAPHLTLVSTYGLARNARSGIAQSKATAGDLIR